jgi:predicted MPP superfamily phosphohydrolase
MKISRRNFLLAFAGAGLTAAYSRYYESRWLFLSQTAVPLRNSMRSNPITILHLSDFHWSPYVPLSLIREAIQLGLGAAPDFACLTGDFVTVGNPYDFTEYHDPLRLLADAVPTFACLGNHDGGSWSRERDGLPDSSAIRNLLTESGVTVLHNDSCAFSVRDRRINLVGLPDLWSGGIDSAAAFAEVTPGEEWSTLVISHNPDSYRFIREEDWDLMLCGHTHGGQLVVPLLGAPYVPVRDRSFIAGLNALDRRLIYTTKGVGSLYGVRFWCRPEVSVLHVH